MPLCRDALIRKRRVKRARDSGRQNTEVLTTQDSVQCPQPGRLFPTQPCFCHSGGSFVCHSTTVQETFSPPSLCSPTASKLLLNNSLLPLGVLRTHHLFSHPFIHSWKVLAHLLSIMRLNVLCQIMGRRQRVKRFLPPARPLIPGGSGKLSGCYRSLWVSAQMEAERVRRASSRAASRR